MAAIGDVLVKFVADFAEFSANMGKSQKEIESWSKSIADAGKSVDGFINLAKRVAGALAIAQTIREVIQFNNEMQKAGEALAAYSLQTDAAARSVRGLTDDSLKLAEMYKAAGREWTEDYLARVTRAQNASEDFNTKAFVLGQRLHNLYLELTQRPGDGGGVMDWASKEANALFDWMEKLVPAVNNVVDTLARGLVLQLMLTAQGIRTVVDATKDLVDWLGRAAKQATVTGSELEKIGRAQAAARGYQTGPAGGGPTGAGGAFGMFDGTSGSQTAAEAARQYQETQRTLGRGFGSIWGVPASMAAPPAGPAGGGGGGGGGTTGEETIDRQIKRYQDLAAAAQRSMDIVRTSTDRTVESLTRQAEVQQQIDEAVTNFIRRYPQATTAQTEAFTAAVTAEKQLTDQRKDFLKDSTAAEATEKRLGDGIKAQALGMIELNKQLASGRLNTTTYDRAVKELTESTQQAALAATRYEDNLGSLAAGFEHAANAYSRSNDLYSLGEQAFTGLTSAMTEGLKALSGQSSKTFGQIAADFANMLADMALKAAVSQAFKLLVSSIGGGVSPAAAPAGGYNAGIGADGMSWITPRAAGGPVSPGQPYVVGERGPEFFVPAAAGNIVPNGGGGSITVNVDMKQTTGAKNPTQALEFGRAVKAAVVGVIANEKRPGGSLYARQTV